MVPRVSLVSQRSAGRRVIVCLSLGMLAAVSIARSAAAQSVVAGALPGGGGAAGGNGQPSVLATIGEPIAAPPAGAAGAVVRAGFLAGLTASAMSGEVPPVAASAGQPATITVTLRGYVAAPAVTLHYRIGGAQEFATAAMAPAGGDGGTWSGVIAADSVGPRGVQFYIVADDGLGSLKLPSGAPAALGNVEVAVTEQPLFATRDTYALRGVGLVAADSDAGAVFGALGRYDINAWRYVTYDEANQAYVEPPAAAPATPGRGFWIISRAERDIRVSGHSTRLDQPVAITLRNGWNLIANPFFFAVSFASLALPAGTDANLIGWQAGGYVNFQSALEPGQGYWLYYDGTAPAALLIPPQGISAKANPSAPLPPHLANEGPGWRVLACAQAGGCTAVDHRFGLAPGATSDRDACDFMAAPLPPAGYLALSFLAAGGARLLNDFRDADSVGELWMLSLDTDQAQESFRVDFAIERALPAGWRLLAIDASTGEEIDLLAGGSISGRTGTSVTRAHWHLAAGPDPYLDQVRRDIMEESYRNIVAFTLRPSFPNPFTAGSGCVVTLAAPRAERVTVRVYDLRGRLVKTLLDGPVDRGWTRLDWHGENHAQQRVAAGVYLVRLRAADADVVQRILLVR